MGFFYWNSEFNYQNSKLKIYPNPAEDYLMVEAEDEGSFLLEIYDMRGTLVAQSSCSCPAKLNITQLPSGVYYLKAIHNDGRREVVNFVKTFE